MRKFQDSTATIVNRYQHVLTTLMAMFPRDAPLRVLVFGGSIGLEALTLSRIFPHSRVVSVEISPEAHRIARSVGAIEPRIAPRLSNLDQLQQMSPFDLVLAHSVLCDHPKGLHSDRLTDFSFDQFEDMIGRLVDRLKPDGALSLVNTSYSFDDSEIRTGFHKVGEYLESSIPKFARDGTKIAQIVVAHAWPFVQISPLHDLDVVREKLSGAVYTRRATKPRLSDALISLSPQDMQVSGDMMGKLSVPGFVHVPVTKEVCDDLMGTSLTSRFVLGSPAT